MLYPENNIARRPLSSRLKQNSPNKGSMDCLTECEWEVFIIRRDDRSGTFKTETACCEEVLVQK